MYLFEEPPVTESEVQDWLDKMPNLSALPSRREAYRKAYNVEEKIRAAKRLNVSEKNTAMPVQQPAPLFRRAPT